jgi:hypothetical protein
MGDAPECREVGRPDVPMPRGNDLLAAKMKLTEFGESPPRNVHCWNAIKETVEWWQPTIEDGILEAHFSDDQTLKLVLVIPGFKPCPARIDISWIEYADQAERLGILTKMALGDIEMALLEQQQTSPAST